MGRQRRSVEDDKQMPHNQYITEQICFKTLACKLTLMPAVRNDDFPSKATTGD